MDPILGKGKKYLFQISGCKCAENTHVQISTEAHSKSSRWLVHFILTLMSPMKTLGVKVI